MSDPLFVTPFQNSIVELLKKSPPKGLFVKDFIDELKSSHQNVSNALKILIEKGLVRDYESEERWGEKFKRLYRLAATNQDLTVATQPEQHLYKVTQVGISLRQFLPACVSELITAVGHYEQMIKPALATLGDEIAMFEDNTIRGMKVYYLAVEDQETNRERWLMRQIERCTHAAYAKQHPHLVAKMPPEKLPIVLFKNGNFWPGYNQTPGDPELKTTWRHV